MKRTDEMKLGEDLRGYCDCNQGRLCCTCRQFAGKTFDRAAKVLNEGGSSEDLFANLVNTSAHSHRRFLYDQDRLRLLSIGPCTVQVDPATIRLNDEPLTPPPTTEHPSDRRKNPIERFSVAAQLQLMKALAILGWAAFFLELLRV